MTSLQSESSETSTNDHTEISDSTEAKSTSLNEEDLHPAFNRKLFDKNPSAARTFFSLPTTELSTTLDRKFRKKTKFGGKFKEVDLNGPKEENKQAINKKKNRLSMFPGTRSQQREDESAKSNQCTVMNFKRTKKLNSMLLQFELNQLLKSNSTQNTITMKDIYDKFRRQKRAYQAGGFREKKKSSAHSTLSLLTTATNLNVDRWREESIFQCNAYFTGYFYQSAPGTLRDYLVQLAGLINEEFSEQSRSRKPTQSIVKVTEVPSSMKKLVSLEPVQMDVFGANVSSIALGYNSMMVLSNLGEVFIQASTSDYMTCFGASDCPIDWTGTITFANILGRRIRFIAVGENHCGALTSNNELIIWGNNSYRPTPSSLQISGQLATNLVNISPPKVITGMEGDPITLACGAHHTLVLTTKGLYSFGSNQSGQLGTESLTNWVPKLVRLSNNHTQVGAIASISCGNAHSLVCTADGLLFAWGSNKSGQLGCGNHAIKKSSTPLLVESIDSIISVSAGEHHSVVLNSSGEVFTFGSNLFGQLGASIDILEQYSPVKIEKRMKGEMIIKIKAGPSSTMLLTKWGIVYICGLLRSKDGLQHQYQPRMHEKFYVEDKFIIDIGSGLTHDGYTYDIPYTNCLQLFYLACKYDKPFISDPIIKEIKQLTRPDKSLKNLQERILDKIYEESKLPYIKTNECFLIFDGEFTRTAYSNYVDITNESDESISVTVNIPKKSTNRYKILVEPSEFKLNRNQSITIRVTFINHKLNDEDIYQLIHLTVNKKGKGKSKVYRTQDKQQSKSPTQTQLTTSQYFIVCFVPKHLSFNSNSLAWSTSSEDNADEEKQITGLDGRVIRKSNKSIQLVKKLGTFTPRVLLQRFVKFPDAPSKPDIKKFPAAILFLDISGFTSLNEQLAQLGPRGPELVSKHINSYFTSLIEAVSEHGGDVLKFAGDALICLFADDDLVGTTNLLHHDDNSNTPTIYSSNQNKNSLSELILRAIQCALEIQTNLAKYQSNEGINLTLHIGIGAGSLYALWTGGVDDAWEFLVSGEPLSQLRTAVDNSESGQVVISNECLQLVKAEIEGEPVENDFWVKKLTKPIPIRANKPIPNWPLPEAEAALRCFIPEAIQVSIDSQQLEGWHNELRKVTVLFVKLNTNIDDSDKNHFLSKINQILRIMQQIIFNYEGMIRQFLADDKGTVLIAAFGLPPFAHIDDPIRGIKSALEIYQSLKEIDIHCSIGITTGIVYCGSVGCPNRQEYAMVGDSVNLSARLMIAAMNLHVEILTDQPTFDASSSVIQFNLLSPINVKGKKNLIHIYQPVIHQFHYHHISLPVRFKPPSESFIGCKQIISFLMTQFDKFASGIENDKRFILISGYLGDGKTFLINHFINNIIHLTKKNVFITIGKTDKFQKETPFYGFQHILTDIIAITNIHESFDISELSTDLVHNMITSLIVDKTLLDYIPLLNDLLPIHFVENDLTSSLPLLQRRKILFDLLKQLLISFSANSTPLLIIMEDAQYLDHFSAQLLLEIAQEHSSIFIISTMITGYSFPLLVDFSTKPWFRHFIIPPLSYNESIELAERVLNAKDLPTPVIKLLVKAKGNPLFITNIALGLVESNVLKVENAKCVVVGDINDIQLASIENVIKNRMDRLPSTQQMILKVGMYLHFPPSFFFALLPLLTSLLLPLSPSPSP